MKTSPLFKENKAFSSAVMTHLTWRYRDRELITASSFKLLIKGGNMSWIFGLDKIFHEYYYYLWIMKIRFTFTLDNKFYSHFASYSKKSRHWAIPTTRHSYTVVNLHPHQFWRTTTERLKIAVLSKQRNSDAEFTVTEVSIAVSFNVTWNKLFPVGKHLRQ